MPNRTINLYDGLEALYYFDSDYFNNGSDEISDQSGYGRHAEAKGGPTVGVEGPDDFEATSFDGSDDYFDIDSVANDEPLSEVTATALVKQQTTNNDNEEYVSVGGFDFTLFKNSSERVAFKIWDTANTSFAAVTQVPANKYHVLAGVHDGDSIRVFRDGDLQAVESTDGNDIRNSGNEAAIGALASGSNNYINADIAFVGVWYRALSGAEIEHLSHLTAPRRAQL